MGAVSFHIDHFVKGRLSKFTYGVPCAILYKPFDSEHARREHKTITDVLGDQYLPCAFETMLSKVCRRIAPVRFTLLTGICVAIQGTKVLENREIRTTMYVVREGAPAKDVLARIVKYDGNLKEPRWIDIEQSATLDSVVWLLCLVLTTQKIGLRLCAM